MTSSALAACGRTVALWRRRRPAWTASALGRTAADALTLGSRHPFSSSSLLAKDIRNVAVVFPGQGSQFVGMAKDIYKDFSVAKDVIDECDEALGGGLRDIMFDGPQKVLTSTINAQPAILCHSIALLRVLEKEHGFDIKSCSYALGHSLGEYSALVATGALELKDAMKLVRLRGQAMQSSVTDKETAMRALIVAGGRLEDIESTMSRIQRSLPEGEIAEIANINSRTQIVISGTAKGVEYAASIVHTKGLAGRPLPLPVSAPFHCSLMAPAADAMGPALAEAKFTDPVIDVVSNVTAQPFTSGSEIGALLKRQIVETVQWERSLRYAKDDFVFDWIVIGPSRVLSNLLRKDFPHDAIRSIATSDDLKKWSQSQQ
ncbi:acyl transferase/acyl hydrolase/lysophospholipase [Entophlyctis helioformis]|nr:acyl transferase/acyl hydrolase/lysophospholipase [Entophlyctis helioformis]